MATSGSFGFWRHLRARSTLFSLLRASSLRRDPPSVSCGGCPGVSAGGFSRCRRASVSPLCGRSSVSGSDAARHGAASSRPATALPCARRRSGRFSPWTRICSTPMSRRLLASPTPIHEPSLARRRLPISRRGPSGRVSRNAPVWNATWRCCRLLRCLGINIFRASRASGARRRRRACAQRHTVAARVPAGRDRSPGLAGRGRSLRGATHAGARRKGPGCGPRLVDAERGRGTGGLVPLRGALPGAEGR